MPRGEWRKCPYAHDPALPFLRVKTDGRKEREYYYALHELLQCIHNHISTVYNVYHTNAPIRRADLPLTYEGQHMDISYINRQRSLVFLQMHVIPYDRLPKRVRRAIQ